MISSNIDSHNSNRNQFSQRFLFALRRAVYKSKSKNFVGLFLKRENYAFSDVLSGAERKFMCQNVDYLVMGAPIQIANLEKWQDFYHNILRRELEIKVDYFVLIDKDYLSSPRHKRVTNLAISLLVRLKVGSD